MQDKNKTVESILRYMSDAEKDDSYNYLNYIDGVRPVSFNDRDTLYRVFNEKIEDFKDGLTFNDLESIRSYTGYNFRNINAILRHKWNYYENGKLDDNIKRDYLEKGKKIEKLIDTFPPIDLCFNTYRGVTLSYFKDYGINNIEDLVNLKNKFIYEEAFTSTSIINGSHFFNKENERGINYNVEIVYKIDGNYSSGALLLDDDLTYSTSQAEYLINKDSLSKVDDVVINGDTATIYVTLLPSKLWDKKRYLISSAKSY